MNTARSKLPWLSAAWALLFLACAWAYWPGLAGPFVLDDFGSIADLGDLGGVTDWNTFKAFVFGGHAGPTGRPLALLTFLVDANNWPADPWPFKRTNLIIHLVNGLLIGLLSGRLLRILGTGRDAARWCALIAAGIWLLHPFLVSTTLYAVQRMAQMSTLFVFLGLLGYLHGRTMVTVNATRAYLVMSASLGLFTLLSILSKENGILLPLLAGVAEVTIFASQRQTLGSLNRYWAVTFLLLPAVVIALYLGARVFRDGLFSIADYRDFSIYERLLTQPRILVDYLQHWFVPELYTTGIFQDHFLKSEGVLRPATTLASIVFHVAAIAFLIIKRHTWPLAAFAGLFFYSGHLLESTVLNLELYFEHRNYLAAAFLFLPLVAALHDKVERRLFVSVSIAVLIMLTGFTRYSAGIWSDYDSMVEASAHKAPTSARAQQQYALNLFNARQYEEAFATIDRAIETMPGKTELMLTRAVMRCEAGILSAEQFESMAAIVAARPYDARQIDFFMRLSNSVANGGCPDVSATNLQSMFSDMLRQPANSDPGSLAHSQVQFFLGLAYVHLGNPASAKQAFARSLEARPGPGHAMMMAAVFADNEFFDEALDMSDLALARIRSGTGGALEGARISETEVVDFQRRVREAIADSADDSEQ